MARRSAPGLLVETYEHTATGVKVEIRYERTKQIHYGVVRDTKIEHKDFDECKKLIVAACAKDDNLVWTPFIELSGRSYKVISVNRYEGAIRPDGSALLIAWDIYEYKNARNELIAAHGGFSDELRNKHSRKWYISEKQSDAILAALTEGKPYRLLNERPYENRPIEGDYSAQLTYLPYTEETWTELQRVVKEQDALNEQIVAFFSQAGNLAPARMHAAKVSFGVYQ